MRAMSQHPLDRKHEGKYVRKVGNCNPSYLLEAFIFVAISSSIALVSKSQEMSLL